MAHEERDDTSAAYTYALYLKPRAEMMQEWASHLEELGLQKPNLCHEQEA